MESSFYLFLFSSLTLIITHSMASESLKKKRCHDDEMGALLQFKHSFVSTNRCEVYYNGHVERNSPDSPYGYPRVETWTEGNDCCSWVGVECDEQTDHVISLDLHMSCLYGSINSSSTVFSLLHLQRLNLAWNVFYSSQIPSAIGNLSSLTHLNLSGSSFTGETPQQLFNITTLVSLDLSFNIGLKLLSLKGLVQHMINLKELHLSYVNLSSSGVPDLLSNLSSLESLDLSWCGLKGEFPAAVFHLPKLKMLNLMQNNDLKGYLPNFRLGSPLKSLLLVRSSFGGVLPPSIGNLVSLEDIDISHCNFTGKLPMSLGNLTQLVSLNLWDGNHFNPDSFTTSSLSWIGKLTKITSLNLVYWNLKGEIPSWLMNLTQLIHIDLSHNKLSGSIPSWLMSLSQLRDMDLSYNQLIGQIPSSLVSLPQLHYIHLSHNQLTGQIPSQFNHLIESFDLSSNNLEGSIPTNLSTLQNLKFLSLEDNRLVGWVELSLFCHLKFLTQFTISHNNLSVTITNTSSKNIKCFPNLEILKLVSCNLSEFPTFLHNHKSPLKYLDLSHNSLRGQIPQWIFYIGQNSRIYETGISLNLSHNLLTGFEQEHSLFRPLSTIETLDLRHNMLQGSLPILPPSSISTFSTYLVSNNNLSGEVSYLICNFTSLQFLDLSFNNFGGKLPQCLGNLSNSLSLLDLRGNKFDGSITSMWRHGCNLKMISMSHNQLQGQLPRSLANCSLLEFVDFGNNKMSDTFPSWLGTVTPLSVLILRSNSLQGVIKDDLGCIDGFSNLRVIDLSNNNFRGNVPSKFIDAANPMRALNASRRMKYMSLYRFSSNDFSVFDYSMTMHDKGSDLNYPKIPDIFCGIDFSSNNFEGQIPDAFGDLVGLHLLNLSRNHLSGHIPSSFSNMKSLECLDLSRNYLSGQIPMELTKLTSLSSFDVSFNNLSGPIPQGNQFCTYESKSYEGNPGLSLETRNKQCGNARSLPQLQQPPSPSDDDDDSEYDSKIKWMIISIGFVSGLVGGVVVGNELTTRKHDWFVKTLARIRRGYA